jgi:anti-sigma factor RsiW
LTDHLSSAMLSALVDGELSAEQVTSANEHLAGCPACTSSALYQSLLKSATARAGERYMPPLHLQEKLARLAAQEDGRSAAPALRTAHVPPPRSGWRFGMLGWATAAAVLLIAVSVGIVQRSAMRSRIASEEHAALVTEVFDQHIATLAANAQLQVFSTDRHTVKPWFQGKIPFSFNLPDGLPTDTKLDGANLTYLHNQAVAQLMYSIGGHRVSVFIRQRVGTAATNGLLAEHSGFHVYGFTTNDLEVVAVGDVDPTRLSDLVTRIEDAQSGNHKLQK